MANLIIVAFRSQGAHLSDRAITICCILVCLASCQAQLLLLLERWYHNLSFHRLPILVEEHMVVPSAGRFVTATV